MSKPDYIVRMVKSREQWLGAIDLIVNNADIQYVSPIEDFRRKSGRRSSRSIFLPHSTRSAPPCPA